MDRKTLLDIRGDTKSRLIALQVSKIDEGQKDEYANVIASLENEIAGIDTKLGELAKADADKENTLNSTLSGEVASEYQLNRLATGLRTRIECIGAYKASGQIHVWLDRLQNVYKLLVEPNLSTYPVLESDFCYSIILSLPLAGQTKFSDEKTWDTLKAGLKAHYSADISVFQHLSKIWGCDLSGTRWNELALASA